MRQWKEETGRACDVHLHVNNNSAINVAKGSDFSRRTKHFDVKYHYFREEVQRGHVVVDYVPTKEQLADIMTKPLTKHSFEYLIKKIMNYGPE